MIVISHRGFWKEPEEKNEEIAFERSFQLGYGTETDLRDLNGDLTISHDPPSEVKIKIKDFLKTYHRGKPNLPLALNIKSDGLQQMVLNLLQEGNITNYFVFDMSIPDTIGYLNNNMNVYTRQSEYEKDVPFYEKVQGVWLDCFQNIWYNEELIQQHLDNHKKVAIVSSELHKRDHKEHWELMKNWKCINNNNLMLCTDLPTEATKFFKYE